MIVANSTCPTDGKGIDEEIIDQNTIKEKSPPLTIGNTDLKEEEESGLNLAVILVPIILFLMSLGVFVYWKRRRELEKARIADSLKNVEDDENPDNALLNNTDGNVNTLTGIRPEDPEVQDNFEKVLAARRENDDALDDLRRQSLAKGATDEEAEKLIK